MIKKFRHLNPSVKAGSVFLFFIILALFIPVKKVDLDTAGILSAAAIFYSILLGFYIAAAMANLSRLKTLVSIETGGLIAIFYIVKTALPERLEQIKKTIDTYLIKRFDYEIEDYTRPTTKPFFEIFDVLHGVDGKSGGDSAAINYIAEGMYYIPQARRELTVVGARVVNTASWVVLDILSLVIVISLFFSRTGSLESSLVTAFLSSSAILALFILDDVDGNKFGEGQFAINTYEDVFSAIGVLPYYSERYLKHGRYVPKEKTYRSGMSDSMYMIENGKKVKLEN